MAMLNAKSRVGAANLGTPLMILSFGVIAGFVYWLSVTAEPTQVVIQEPTEAPADGTLSMSEFSTDPTQHIDTEVTLQDVPVTSLLGPHSFWTSLSDANDTPYLVHLSPDLTAAGTSVTAGSTLDIRGTVLAMSDSILDAWEAAGAFPGGADRIQAEFAENFIEAAEVEEVASAAAPSS